MTVAGSEFMVATGELFRACADMPQHRVMISGGGIGGLAMALTLDQIGVHCVVFETVRELRPLGVGINLQPNAVRELYDLGIAADEVAGFGGGGVHGYAALEGTFLGGCIFSGRAAGRAAAV
jgi:2-polyprenyl-6-methoxyphenol hydroxylase-like FAD-dependent oxidoreductase